jgi:hypothetical protein
MVCIQLYFSLGLCHIFSELLLPSSESHSIKLILLYLFIPWPVHGNIIVISYALSMISCVCEKRLKCISLIVRRRYVRPHHRLFSFDLFVNNVREITRHVVCVQPLRLCALYVNLIIQCHDVIHNILYQFRNVYLISYGLMPL